MKHTGNLTARSSPLRGKRRAYLYLLPIVVVCTSLTGVALLGANVGQPTQAPREPIQQNLAKTWAGLLEPHAILSSSPKSFERVFPKSPFEACRLASTGLAPEEYEEVYEEDGQSCYWGASLVVGAAAWDTSDLINCAVRSAAKKQFQLEQILEGCGLALRGSYAADPLSAPVPSEFPSIYFFARGTQHNITYMRFKLNSGARLKDAHLKLLYGSLTRLFTNQQWALPDSILAALENGESAVARDGGVEFDFSREYGNVPRFNLTILFPGWTSTDESAFTAPTETPS